MRVCPKCGATYADDLSYCLDDGTALQVRPTADLSNAPTEAYQMRTNAVEDYSAAETLVSHPNPLTPPPKQFQMSIVNPANRMGCVVSVGTVAALMLVVFGLGGAGIYLFRQGSNDLASAPPFIANKPAMNSANSTATNSTAANSASNTNAPVPSATVKTSPNTVSGGVLNGKATSLPKPEYPPAARAVRAQGSVSVQVLVDESGKVISASAVSGHPLLKAAAVSAARQAIFSPTLLSGKAVKVSGVITYNFVL